MCLQAIKDDARSVPDPDSYDDPALSLATRYGLMAEVPWKNLRRISHLVIDLKNTGTTSQGAVDRPQIEATLENLLARAARFRAGEPLQDDASSAVAQLESGPAGGGTS